MCTVSFCKVNEQIIITSNRDEHINRPSALAPQKFALPNTYAYFPVDPQANGTWFCVKQNGEVFVLLNGAATKHTRATSYKKSRGLILLELIDDSHPLKEWERIDLNQIEPFTIVAYTGTQLHQWRWDGRSKSTQELQVNGSYIWSSATLYDPLTITNRQVWFSKFLQEHKGKPNADDIIQFHTQTHAHDPMNGLIINRNDTILTKNVTQCILQNNEITIRHLDQLNKKWSVLLEPII